MRANIPPQRAPHAARRVRVMHPILDLRHRPAGALVGLALVAIVLLVLPFVLTGIGTFWVRITNLAILFCLLALELNIVVGFAGLLDLGYIAFYAVGAYVYALLASPHFNIHLPFWIILPIGAAVACLFGALLGAPTLKLRGDHLAIVTLGFGEIVRIFLNNCCRASRTRAVCVHSQCAWNSGATFSFSIKSSPSLADEMASLLGWLVDKIRNRQTARLVRSSMTASERAVSFS